MFGQKLVPGMPLAAGLPPAGAVATVCDSCSFKAADVVAARIAGTRTPAASKKRPRPATAATASPRPTRRPAPTEVSAAVAAVPDGMDADAAAGTVTGG